MGGSGNTERSRTRTSARLSRRSGVGVSRVQVAGRSRHTGGAESVSGGTVCEGGGGGGPPSLVQTLLHPHQEVMSQDDEGHMVVPPPPEAGFIVVQAHLLIPLRKAGLDGPA